MKRKRIVGLISVVFVASLIVTGCGSDDDQKDSYDVGLVVMDHMMETKDTFQAAMVGLGYTEGENITFHVYEFEAGEVPEASDIARFDVVLALEAGDNDQEPLGVVSALEGGDKIPIVFIADNSFPMEAGYVESIQKPGKNVTGVMEVSSHEKRLELFHEMLPDAMVIMVVYDATEEDALDSLGDLEELAADFEISILPVAAAELNEFIASYDGTLDAVYSLQAHDVFATLVDFARENNLPLSSGGTNVEVLGITEAGYALMIFDADDESAAVRAAALTHQILNGANPGELPVESSDSTFIVDLVTADRLNLEIDDHILTLADEILRAEGGSQ